MKDKPLRDEQLAAILARTERLSIKRRALLDVLLKRNGIEVEQALQSTLRAKDARIGMNDKDSGERCRTARTAQDRHSSVSPMITMRSSGSKVRFFCVHALLGSVFHYHRLAAYMDPEQPFYALQAPGLDGSETPLETVDAFAQFYLRAVREVQPKGPYRLGGYS